jgi:peroxiredoxin (alkyl hydroperoxide reductase subunit C)
VTKGGGAPAPQTFPTHSQGETMSEGRMPRINEVAPDFEAKTTHGMLKLSDITSKGKWVVLFSHPADFTPVCTTEFIEFSKRHDEFAKRNTQLLGNSIDSVYSHIAWVRNIEQNFNVKVPFPVIADLDQKVARAFGMVHEAVSDTATVRAVFVIDPKNVIRAMIYYPMSLGRSVDEIVRIVDALQTADANACATPANWQPGDAVIVPAPATQADAEKRVAMKEYDVSDWYLSKRKLATAAKA